MSLRPRTIAFALAALICLGVPALTACGGAVQGAVEKAAGDAIGGNVDINSDGLSVTDKNGNQVQIGENVQLPANWPAEVPTFAGGKLASVLVAGDGASVNAMWTTDAAVADASAAYVAALTAAGYTEDQASNAGGVSTGQYTGNGYRVNVVTSGSGGTTSVLVNAEKAAPAPS